MQPYNGHISSSLGNISDRSGNVLATSTEEGRTYSDSETVRRALLHTVGDPYGYISTSVEYTMRDKLTGYNLITGLNDTIFNRNGQRHRPHRGPERLRRGLQRPGGQKRGGAGLQLPDRGDPGQGQRPGL